MPQIIPIVPPVPDYNNIRTFSDESIQNAVTNALNNTILPPGTKGVAVAHMTLEGARVSLIAKLPGDHWSVAADAFKPFNGKLEAGAKVVFHW